MLYARNRTTGKLARVAVAGGFLWSVLAIQAQAEELSKQQIFDALVGGKSITRSLSLGDRPAQSQEDLAFVESLRYQGNRSLSLADREHVAAIAKNKPKVDLEIYFDFNSVRLSARAVPQLTTLGQTLIEPEFKDTVFLIGGYTDAKGSDSYNQELSERRAETVKQFLVERFHFPAANLVTAGYGKQHLKNPDEPFSAENRRVQIGNLNAQQAMVRPRP